MSTENNPAFVRLTLTEDQQAHVRASIGIDIVSTYAADMLAQARLARQSARAMHNHALAASAKAPRSLKRTAHDALRLATLGGAEALHLEDRIGSLEAGQLADLVVLDRDYFTVPDNQIRNLRSVLTLVDGRIVHNNGVA